MHYTIINKSRFGAYIHIENRNLSSSSITHFDRVGNIQYTPIYIYIKKTISIINYNFIIIEIF